MNFFKKLLIYKLIKILTKFFGFVYYNIRKIIFLILVWFYNNFIKIIPLWKKVLFYNWVVYLGSVILLIVFLFHSQHLLYDWYASHAYWYMPLLRRRRVMCHWIALFFVFTLITILSSFYYELARHWKFYGDVAYGGYVFYYSLFRHWYFWEHELDYVEETIGYSYFFYKLFFWGMAASEWEEELDEDWDDARLHNSRIAQDRGTTIIDKNSEDKLTEEDMMMLFEMNNTNNFQSDVTDYFGNSFDIGEEPEDIFNNYDEWEIQFFPDLHLPLTEYEQMSEDIENLLLSMPVNLEDHVMYEIFQDWDSKRNWLAPEYWEVLVWRGQSILNIINFLIRIFMFFFKYFKRFYLWLYHKQLQTRGKYKEYLIRAVGPYMGYDAKFRRNIKPDMTIEVVSAKRRTKFFFFIYFIIKSIKYYWLEIFRFIIKNIHFHKIFSKNKWTVWSDKQMIQYKKLKSWGSSNYVYFGKGNYDLSEVDIAIEKMSIFFKKILLLIKRLIIMSPIIIVIISLINGHYLYYYIVPIMFILLIEIYDTLKNVLKKKIDEQLIVNNNIFEKFKTLSYIFNYYILPIILALVFILFNFWVCILLYIKICETINNDFQGICVDTITLGILGIWPELEDPLRYIQNKINDPAFINQVIIHESLFITKVLAWVNLILAYAFVFCIYIGIVCYEILQYSCGWLSEPPLHSITHNIHSYLLIIILSIYLLFIVYFINLTENYNLKITLKFIVVGIFIYMAFYIYENFILYAAIFKLYPLFSVIASLFYFLILIVLLYFEFKKDAQKRRKKEK